MIFIHDSMIEFFLGKPGQSKARNHKGHQVVRSGWDYQGDNWRNELLGEIFPAKFDWMLVETPIPTHSPQNEQQKHFTPWK